MKYILPLIAIFAITSTSQAVWPFNGKPVPKPTPAVVAKPAPTPKPTISGGREIVKEISVELKAAKEENAKLKASLDKATQQVVTAEAKTIVVQKQADNLKEWGVIQQAEAQKFMDKYNNAVKRYHRLKAIAAVIAAAVGVLLGLQFMNFAPPPYNIGVPVGAAALFAALVWFFL
jgi:alpha/beta superfamily hydrolase